uniref:Zinc finger BED domain-containing protein 1-like n=1 Tax=Strongyloides venezuelensis TaxID=75913 RepID=A0A0K0EUR5_STRVS
MPRRRTIVENINEMHIYHMDQLKQKIEAVITLSCINEDDEVENIIYEVYEVSTSTKGKNLADDLVSSLSKINLSIDEITAITTDGASNIRSLCEQLECYNIHCLSHILNLILKTSVEKQKILKELIGCIRNSVIKCKRPKKASVLKLKRKLKMDCKTRWNSLNEMLRSLVRNENDFKEFTTTEYILIKAILEILQPFGKYTLISNTSNILQHIPILLKVRDEIKSINTKFDNLLSNNENKNINHNVDVSEDEEESEDFLSEVEDFSENSENILIMTMSMYQMNMNKKL